MSETKRQVCKPFRSKKLQQGVAAVEFALIAVAFFTLVFGVIDVARLMFLFNTLPEVTSRAAIAASSTDFTNTVELDRVRQRAIFRDSPGGMVLMQELTDQSIRIDYMSINRNDDGTLTMVPIPVGSLPSSPAANRRACLVDPNSPTCIRIVRVRVCNVSNSGACDAMQFQSLVALFNLSLPLPTSTTLVKAQSLGL
ncbi:MAG: pilus assembly protein TadE [Massilia sp.]|jgi:hypothetical protein|nr:pilus assembly protein TadE [Massilia sp.]